MSEPLLSSTSSQQHRSSYLNPKVKNPGKPHGDHIRQEMQDFGSYPRPELVTVDSQEKFEQFCKALSVNGSTLKNYDEAHFESWKSFVQDANTVAEKYKSESQTGMSFSMFTYSPSLIIA